MNKKKAQNEMAGLMVIVVLVFIVGLIFFSLTMGNTSSKSESVEVSNLLSSFIHYTTNCSTDYIPNYKDGQGLIKACYNGRKCLNEDMACKSLNKTFKGILGKGLDICGECVNKGYELKVYHKANNTAPDYILEMKEGGLENCSSKVGGSYSIDEDVGEIIMELDICKS